MENQIQIKRIDDYNVEVIVIQTKVFKAGLRRVQENSWLAEQGYTEKFCDFSGYCHAYSKERRQWDYVDKREREVLQKNVGNPLANEQLIISEAIPERTYYNLGLNNPDINVSWC
jgi:hypothetical protein